MALDETLVASSASCRYQVPTDGSLGTSWTARTFTDSAWSLGASGLGYDNESTYTLLFGATVPNTTSDIYARYAFQVLAGKSYSGLTLRVKYDDGFIAYLNGTEIARTSAPAGAVYNSTATANHDDNLALVFQDFDVSTYLPQLVTGANVLAVHALNTSPSSDFLILPELVAGVTEVVTNIAVNEFMALNDATLMNSLGKYDDWIELYNPNSSSVSLAGWYLTDNSGSLMKWQFPAGPASTIAGKGYLLVWADSKSYAVTNSELHASFSLSGGGEYLGVVRPDGVTVTYAYAPTFPAQYDDVSYGIGMTGENRYFGTPTPGAANAFSGPSNEVSGVKFSPKRGVYTSALPAVTATTDTAGAEIRYTLDAEPPAEASTLYSAPLALDHTAVIRAAAYKSGLGPSGIDTHTYISADDVLRQPDAPAGFPTRWTGAVYDVPADYGMSQTVVAGAGAALTNALKALPSLSLVTPQANLFDTATGIYVNPTAADDAHTGTDDAWERGASVEWIDPDNASRFQIDCGLRIQGGWFRRLDLTRKKSFSLRFRGSYGAGRLEEGLFSGSATGSFNDLILRAGACDAWNILGQERVQYIADEFLRRTHLAMGGVSPHGRFVQLYLNGLYWGLYNVTEKVSGEFAATYCGGRDDTWDVLCQNSAQVGDWLPPDQIEGDLTAWQAMMSVLSTDQGSSATYQKVQGNSPDGTRNPAYPVYLDVGNYIDYMVAEYWSGNFDWPHNNWRMFRDRNESASTGFKFAVWDAEYGLATYGDLNNDTTGSAAGVAVIQSRLAANAEYRLRFADAVQKHFFNGGELSPDVTVPRYEALAAEVEPAIVAESARWGDQDGSPSHTVEQWRTRRDYVLNTFLPQRGAYALQHFKNRGLYPAVDAPAFSRFGGVITNSLSLTVAAANPVYYTTDGSDPRQYGTGAAVGSLYADGVALTRTTRVKARARSAGGVWSALTDAVFTLSEKPALRVTELMFHPRRPVDVSGEGYLDGEDEFIELRNEGPAPVGLAGLSFTQGVAFDFTEGSVQTLNAGEYVLVVRNISAFTNRYPSVPAQRIAGAFAFPSTSLDNAGEAVEIQDALGRAVVSFTYDNAWLVQTDGAGHSLIPLPGAAQADGEMDYAGNWKASAYIGGSPGQAEPAAPAPTLALNEILAHTDYAVPPYDSNDGIELYNATDATLTLGAGWYLSDDPENLTKWAIPATNSLAAHGWRWFDEVNDFHSPVTNGFGLNKAGEQVLLSYLPGTGQDRVVDAVSFKGEENGVPLVRYPDGAATWFYGVSTPGASNRLTEAGVQISEIAYHPRPTAENPENNENDEFVELFNPTAQPVTLKNLAGDVGVWRLAGGIEYLFPDATALPAGGRLAVVPFNPAADPAARDAFLSAYGLTNGQVRLFGPYTGQLNNKADTVRLERPVNPDAAGDEASWHAVDAVTYYDAAPWPADTDGTGRPLTRLPGQNSGGDPSSWVAGFTATPGEKPAKVYLTAPARDSGSLVPALITVTASVDPVFVVGSVHQIVFAVDGVDAASVSAPPYTAGVALDAREGVRRITARLTDDEGAYTCPAVTFAGYTNIPAFTAIANQTVNLTVTNRVGLHATAEILAGMTEPVRFVWSCPGDASVVFENPSQADAAASFTHLGQYDLMLTMFYGQMETNRFFTVTVTDTNTLNRVPYRESFETYERGSTLIGIGGWYGADAKAAVVETNLYAAPVAGGYPLTGQHEQSLSFSGGVSNLFERTGGLTHVVLDMLLACEPIILTGEDQVDAKDQIAFYVNGDQRLMVWHGQVGGTNRWTELPDVNVGTNAFMRLTVEADYVRDLQGSFGFRLWINRVPVTRPAVWFATASTNCNFLSSMNLKGEGQVDDLVADNYNSMLYRRITAAAGPHGRVAPAGELMVPVGGSTNIAVLPDVYYQVGALRVDGEAVAAALGYTFQNVVDEHAFSAEFAERLTSSGVPEVWLNRVNPAWTDNFDAHEHEDLDGDGQSTGDEYVTGTDATNGLSVFRLDLGVSNGVSVVSFPTMPEGGFYGLGGLRRYALYETSDLVSGGWLGVSGLTRVTGDGQAVTYTNRTDHAPQRFFRGRVWLEP